MCKGFEVGMGEFGVLVVRMSRRRGEISTGVVGAVRLGRVFNIG